MEVTTFSLLHTRFYTDSVAMLYSGMRRCTQEGLYNYEGDISRVLAYVILYLLALQPGVAAKGASFLQASGWKVFLFL